MSMKVKKPKEERKPAEVQSGKLAQRAAQHPLLTLREEVDSLFDDFFSGFHLGPFGRHGLELEPLRRMERVLGSIGGAAPRMDVSETAKNFELCAELPGMDEKDIEVTLSDGTLTIEGEKREEKEKETTDYHLTERHFGSIRRSFKIPETVDEDKITASFRKGVLTLTMPKTKTRGKAKKVTIKAM